MGTTVHLGGDISLSLSFSPLLPLLICIFRQMCWAGPAKQEKGGKRKREKEEGDFFREGGRGGKASPNFPVLSHQHLFFSRRSFPSLLFLNAALVKINAFIFLRIFLKYSVRYFFPLRSFLTRRLIWE